MMHKAWSSSEEVPYCFSRSSVKFQGHTALEIVEFDPNWAFPDCNSSLKSPMATKWCTKLEVALKRCPVVFQGHPSNSKVIWDKTSPILTQIGRCRTIGRSQLSNPSDLPCYISIILKTIKTSTRVLILETYNVLLGNIVHQILPSCLIHQFIFVYLAKVFPIYAAKVQVHEKGLVSIIWKWKCFMPFNVVSIFFWT